MTFALSTLLAAVGLAFVAGLRLGLWLEQARTKAADDHAAAWKVLALKNRTGGAFARLDGRLPSVVDTELVEDTSRRTVP